MPSYSYKKNLAPKRFPLFNLWGYRSFLYYGYLKEREYSLAMLTPILQSILLAVVFILVAEEGTLIAGIAVLDFIAPGLIASSVLQRAYQLSAYGLMEAKYVRSYEDWFMAPLWAVEILIGLLTPAIIVGVGVGILMMGAMWLLMDISFAHPLRLILLMCLLSLGGGVLGIITSVLAMRWDGISAIENFILLPMTLFSGCFFPLSAIGGDVAYILSFNPLVSLVDAFREASLGSNFDLILQKSDQASLGLIYPLIIIFMISLWAWLLLRLGYKIKG